ncbi:MAG: hypothetical protein A2Y34_14640 [Spirochaetes bacterium GWC1_27_15]|nr:MAG: hypothetical protein A2Z98_11780 [Spirochaetes bacterium GWB1_27_13]OHD27897.1 MAG: hypothetical protein A2Y34_14640 [Spirochaetes bacterium GWC1_27_15]
MYTTYRINANEIDVNFIEGIKKIFKDREIEITIYNVDETEYLLSSEQNKKNLLKAIENVNQNKNLIEIDIDNLQ